MKSKISLKGEGGEALIRGEGDMALQLICEVLNHPELELVGPVPIELGAYIDTSVAVSSRSTQQDAAKAFVAYITGAAAAARCGRPRAWTATRRRRNDGTPRNFWAARSRPPLR